MRSSVSFFCIGLSLVNVDCSPIAHFSSQNSPSELSSIPSTISSSDPLTVELRDRDIRDSLAKVHPTTKNLSTKTISDIFLACLDNDFSTNDSMTAASQPKCMALGIFPTSYLKLGPIIDEIIRPGAAQFNTQSAGQTETNEMLKESVELEQRIVDTWSALLNNGYMLARGSVTEQASPMHKFMQGFRNKVTALRKRGTVQVADSTPLSTKIFQTFFRLCSC